jgi:hypothetical protein
MSPDDVTQALMTTFEAVSHCCRERFLGNMNESTLKSAAVEALLMGGFAVMEGTSRAGMGKVLRLKGQSITLEFVPRPPVRSVTDCTRASSPDIRIWETAQMVIELQARSRFSSQDATSTPAVLDDLTRVSRGGADVFILAADRSIYDAMCGIRSDLRGRRLKQPGVLKSLFPSSSALANGYSMREGSFDGSTLATFARKVVSPSGEERVIVGVLKHRAAVESPAT